MSQVLISRRETNLHSLEEINRLRQYRQDMPVLFLKSLYHPGLGPVIDRIFNIPELFGLANICSMGESQLHHVMSMAEKAINIPENVLANLGLDTEKLITAILFHDIGKGSEADDDSLGLEQVHRRKIPKILHKYGVPLWAEYFYPVHHHISNSVQIAESYSLDYEIITAIALHHHVKITPHVLSQVAKPLALTPYICKDILEYCPEQHRVEGSNLAQVLAALNQLTAIERRFGGKVFLSVEPGKLEDELTKDLVIGVADNSDPRLKILGFDLTGEESVILLDLSSFGQFVLNHNEYQVQAAKKEVLNTIRSLTRDTYHRSRDLVGLIGGDEYVVITPVTGTTGLERMIRRLLAAIKTTTGFDCKVGIGKGDLIPENFHFARTAVNSLKETKKHQ